MTRKVWMTAIIAAIALTTGCKSESEEYAEVFYEMAEVAREHREDCAEQKAQLQRFLDEHKARLDALGDDLEEAWGTEADLRRIREARDTFIDAVGERCQWNGPLTLESLFDTMGVEPKRVTTSQARRSP